MPKPRRLRTQRSVTIEDELAAPGCRKAGYCVTTLGGTRCSICGRVVREWDDRLRKGKPHA